MKTEIFSSRWRYLYHRMAVNQRPFSMATFFEIHKGANKPLYQSHAPHALKTKLLDDAR